MEEFEHMIVEEFKEEDFYETIEAPKFVDLTAPDHRPEGDDRFWFCSRVGCDQKHEEFMDSEVIYKNFLLRVMAARSPSVRLRRALYRNDSSVEPKCPNTVPAKPSRSRVSKLAMISSIPHKANIKSKEAKVVSSTNKNAATPKAKVKGKDSSVISSVPRKALTERKKPLQSPAGFRSVQNPRIRASGNKAVAKALMFQSPKKLVKLKRSVELSSSVKKICNAMRKLEIEKKKRNGLEANDHKVPARKPLRGREVKSRVFDSLRSQKQIKDKAKAKGTSTLKQKVKEKEEPVLSSDLSKAHEANGIKLENRSLCCGNNLPRTDKINGVEEFLVENKSDELDKAKMEIEDKENECDDKENVNNVVDVGDDDKENSSALDNNRKVDNGTGPLMKKKVFGKKENCKTTRKVMKITDKCSNGKTASASTCVKYTKPKLTNPKPFRLRTDERQILKEANTEKKPQCALVKEETASILGCHGENLDPKHHPVRLEKNTRGNVSSGTSTKPIRRDASENMRVALGTKKKMASKRVATVEDMNVEESREVATINKSPVCVVASGEKRPATVPKGPNFHSIHVPKSCTKRVVSQV